MNHARLPSHTTALQTAVFVCATFIYAIMRPYKLNVMNNVDIAILFLLEILTLVLRNPTRYQIYLILASTLLLLIPHMHGTNVLHLPQVGKQNRRHSVPKEELR